MSTFEISEFKGVIPAAITVFDHNENLDEPATRDYVRYLLGFKIGGLYLTGSTGEGFLMTHDERKKYVEIVIDEVNGKIPVVVHVGAISTKISIELAKHAEKCGAAGISSVPPFYWKFSENEIYQYYKDIAESVGIPMIAYNIPLAGMMTVDMVKRIASIENVKGIKYTGPTIFELTQIADSCGKDFLLYGGCDEMAASNIALGCHGIIGSFYNIFPDLFTDIFNSGKNGNQSKAQELQKYGVLLITGILRFGNMFSSIKSILRKGGINAGYCRRPFHNYTEAEQQEIFRAVRAIQEKYGIKDVDILNRLALINT